MGFLVPRTTHLARPFFTGSFAGSLLYPDWRPERARESCVLDVDGLGIVAGEGEPLPGPGPFERLHFSAK